MTNQKSIMNCMGKIFRVIGISLFMASILIFTAASFFKKEPDWKLIWSDEFEYSGSPDELKWSYDIGDGCPEVCNWGNDELQYYTNGLKNARVENGKLILTAIKEEIYKYHYSSARIKTKTKGDFKYGKIEVNAKLPLGRGVWPAIWMLSTDWQYGGWPDSGEIDIMEKVGFIPDSIFASVHTKAYHHSVNTQKTNSVSIPTNEDNFHIYGLEWDEKSIKASVDNNVYFIFNNENKTVKEWPFDQKFHLILNIAVGGHWGGKQGIDDAIWPQKMEVEYVRIFQKVN